MRSDLLLRGPIVALLLALAPAAQAETEALVGARVGNADALRAEGNRLYNRRQHAAAAEKFLQATRAQPTDLSAYLSLARARLGAGQVAPACYAYRAYVRHAPAGDDRTKAQRELELCDRKSRTAKKSAEETLRDFVDRKAGFYEALEAGRLAGEDGAGIALASLVLDGYLGPDLGEMAEQLATSALRAAEDLHERALRREAIDPAELRAGAAHYEIAGTFGPPPANAAPRRAFFEGLAALRDATRLPEKGEVIPAAAEAGGGFQVAIERFGDAARAAPEVAEYRYFRALALWRSGDRAGAFESMKRDLPKDPRTAVAGAILAIESGSGGAAELERVLFESRFPGGN